MVSPDEFRETLGAFASGVTVVTGKHLGVPHAATMTAFCSVSLSPPLVLICVGKDSRSHEFIASGGIFAVNILHESQDELATVLARTGESEDKAARGLVGISHYTKVTGAPILSESHAYLDCTVVQIIDAGDHTVFLGRPEAAGFSKDDAPLVYHKRRFGQFLKYTSSNTS